MKRTILTLAIVAFTVLVYGQSRPTVSFGEITIIKHSYRKTDTIPASKDGLFGVGYRSHKAYMEIVIERNGKKCADTIINDTVNAIRCLLKEIDKLRYEKSLIQSMSFKTEKDKKKYLKSIYTN